MATQPQAGLTEVGDAYERAEAWMAGHTLVRPEGPASAPWDFPPPAFETVTYDFPRPPLAAPADESEPPLGPKRLPADQWLHQPQWTRLRRARIGTHEPRRTAVVVAPAVMGDASWRFLERHYARVVTVSAGEAFTRLDEDRYEADPADTGQLAALLEQFTRDTGPGVDWLHALPLALDGSLDEHALESAQLACLDTVAALARALADVSEAVRPRAWLLSHGAQPVSGSVHIPEAGLLAAGLEVPRQELGVTLRWIDLPGPRPADWAAHLPDLLLDDTITEPATALRDGFWWQRTLQPVQAPNSFVSAVRSAAPGIHLVLGGTGASAPPWPPVSSNTPATEWSSSPGDRDTARAPTAPGPGHPDPGRPRHGRPDRRRRPAGPASRRPRRHRPRRRNGRRGLLARRDPATARRATAVKLRAALLVERLIAEHDPDYAAYCSSMAARFGGVGQFDYAAANACLDAYAHHAAPAATPPPCV